MKFWEILSGSNKCTAEDIAKEIASLEKRLPEFEQAVKTVEKKAIKLRQMRIGGGKVSDAEAKDASAEFEAARLDLEAARTSLVELRVKLNSMIKNQLETEIQGLKDEEEKFNSEKEKAFKDLIQKAIKVQFLRIRLYGENIEGDLLGCYMATRVENAHQVRDEIKRLEKEQTTLSFYEREKEIKKRIGKLRQQTVEGMVEELFAKMGGKDVKTR